MTAPTAERRLHVDNLMRTTQVRIEQVREGEDDDGLTIEGYAAVFNTFTRIDSWEGIFDEEFAPGAFKKTLREAGLPRMQFDHGAHPLLGSLPLGVWTDATEDGDGLRVVGRLSDSWLVEPFRQAIADGAVNGMSIRFTAVRDVWRFTDGRAVPAQDVLRYLWEPPEEGPLRRTVKESKIPEAGPVTWPAYTSTSVGVRSQVVIDLGRLAEREQQTELARVLIAADAAATRQQDDAPPSTDPDGDPAAEHADEHDDEPHATEAPPVETSAGEHESTPDPDEDEVDRLLSAGGDRAFSDALAEIRSGLAITVKEIPR